MYQTIYIDIVFLTNFLMDYMLLRLVGRFLHLGGSRFRCLASAALGAGFSCLLLYMPVRIVFPVAVLIHGSCAFFMAAFAFRLKRGCLLAKTILAMYLTAFVVGGIYQALETEGTMTGRTFLLFLAGTYGSLYTLTCVAETFRLCRKNIYPVTLIYQGKKQQSYGFFDTGNLLMDPVSRQPVSIVKPELAGLRPHFLSCRTAGGKEGLLLGVILTELTIQTPGRVVHVGKPVLAITFEPSALGEEYGILLNSRLLN